MGLEQDIRDLMQRMKKVMYDSDYKQYMKLTDTLSNTFSTYMRICKPERNSEFCIWYMGKLFDASQEIHKLMVTDNNDEYRCLSYIYNKLLKEFSIFEGVKAIDTNNINSNIIYNKKECKICHEKLDVNINFYNCDNIADGRMNFCKSCIKKLVKEDINNFYEILKLHDKPFIKEIWEKSINRDIDNAVGLYFKDINSLFQNKSLKWNDSKFSEL
jgi:hypothetical protein